MKKHLTLTLCVLVVILMASSAGCVSKDKYQTLLQERDTLEGAYETLDSNLKSAQREYEFLEAKMASLQKEWDTTKASLDSTISQVQGTNTELQKQISTLQGELDDALQTEVRYTYKFTFQYRQFAWELSIPLKIYLEYQAKSRPSDNSRFAMMIKDTGANSLLDILVKKVKDASLEYNYTKTDTVNLVGAFVQSLQYTNNEIATPPDAYPHYPIETLYDQGIDSEDTSILAAALLWRLEYNQVFFVFPQPKHVGLGIDAPATFGSTGWEYTGKRYVYLETIGDNWALGNCPSVFTSLQPEIIPIPN